MRKFLSIAAAFLCLGNAVLLSALLSEPRGGACAEAFFRAEAFFSERAPVGALRFGRVREDVFIEECDVSGLPYAEAEALVRSKLEIPPLDVVTPSGRVRADLSCSDNLAYLVRHAKRGDRLKVKAVRRWADMESALYEICRANSRPAADAKLGFSRSGFSYSPETEGIACDYARLVFDASAALESGGREVELHVRKILPRVTEKSLRAATQKLSSFSTGFDGGNAPRAHNIALAASRISGTTLLPGQEFSFNRTVGERTAENGFEIANVIEGGKFVPGVGGGVCQVSTTLFGAALRAGMKITRSRAHSLSVDYVPPSLDAMVSSESDLSFENPFDTPVYILSSVREGVVGFTFYGLPNGRRYETESIVRRRIPPPEPEIAEGETGVLRREKEGIESESFLLVYDSLGRLVSKTRIRKDLYAAVRGKIGSIEPSPQQTADQSDPASEPPERSEFSDSADRAESDGT